MLDIFKMIFTIPVDVVKFILSVIIIFCIPLGLYIGLYLYQKPIKARLAHDRKHHELYRRKRGYLSDEYSVSSSDWCKENAPRYGMIELIAWILIILSFVSTCSYELETNRTYADNKHMIYALQDTHGMFINGSRYHIDGETKLIFDYMIKSNGVKVPKQAKNNVGFVEYDGEPYVIHHIYQESFLSEDKWHYPITKHLRKPSDVWYIDRYTFYVSDDAITSDIKVDFN